MSGGLESARDIVRRACALAREGGPESLEESAALLARIAEEGRAWAPELEYELESLTRLAGQAASFYAHCLAPPGGGPPYTATGAALARPEPRLLIEG